MGNRVKGKSRRARAFLLGVGLLLTVIFPLSLFTFSPVTLAILHDSAAVSTTTREGRLAVFDDVWSRINERYYDRGFHGLDWDAQRTNFRLLAAEAGSGEELYAVLRRMIASLNDPHTRIFSPEEKFDWWRPRFVSTGLGIAEVDGRPTVVKVERGSAPQRAGIRVGDVIETVDGKTAETLIQTRLKELTAHPNASSRFRAYAKLLDGPTETSIDVSWKAKDGKDRKSTRLNS